MYIRQLLFVTALVVVAIISKTYAQNNVADSSSVYTVNKNIQQYTNHRGNNLQLYNGIEYVFLFQGVRGTSFFATATLEENNIVYDGALYQHVPLAFDIATNQVVTTTPDNHYIQLIPEKISSFTINNRLFIQLTPADVANTTLTPGFYDATINSAATVLIKHVKTVMHSSKPDEPDHFNEYNYYYIKKDTSYYEVKNNRSLLNILRDKSNEIKAFMHQHKLKVKKNPEQALIRTVEYYAQLKK